MQGEKQKPGLYLQQAENILVLNPKIYSLVRWTANVFLLSEAIKIAVIFCKFQCLYAMLLLWDN